MIQYIIVIMTEHEIRGSQTTFSSTFGVDLLYKYQFDLTNL